MSWCEPRHGSAMVFRIQAREAVSTNYEKGSAFERYVANKLRKDGWRVWKTAGSKGEGKVDLLAMFPTTNAQRFPLVHLIQCKSGKKPISGKEKDELIETAEELGVTAAVAFKDKSGRVVITVVE